MKHFIPAVPASILMLFTLVCTAQEQFIIPDDPAVMTGKTADGLTYYLIKRPQGSGLADFYLLRRFGTAVEDSSTAGMTRLVNSVSLYDTRSFPEGSLPATLHRIGAPGRKECRVCITDRNWSLTGWRDIPTGGTACDSVLLALMNVCGGAEILEETIGSDRNFYRNFILPEMTDSAGRFFRASLLPEESSGEISFNYAAGMACSHSPADLRRFFRKWYRPDLQAVVVIGDFDAGAVRNSINALFSALPRTSGSGRTAPAADRLPPGKESFLLLSDREAGTATVGIHLLSAPLPPEERRTQMALVNDYLHSVLMELVKMRVREASPETLFPIRSFRTGTEGFPGPVEADDVLFEIRTTPESVPDALSFLSGILDGVRQGVTASEYARACDTYLAGILQTSSGTRTPGNDYYLKGCLRHFLLGYPIPSWADRGRYTTRMKATFDWKQMNDYLSSFIGDDSRKVITVVSPETYPDMLLEQSYSSGKQIPRVPGLNALESAPSPVPSPSTVSLKKASTEPITKSSAYSLPNGASVIFKKDGTHKGELCFEAFSKGGISLSKSGFRSLARYINPLAELSVPSVPDTSTIELSRTFTGSISTLRGRCQEKDIEEFFRMIRECFRPASIDKASFSKLLYSLTSDDIHSFDSPDRRFDMMASDYLIPASDRITVDYQMVRQFINICFSCAGDFTFLFSGDISEDRIKHLTEEYLSSLPGRSGKRMVPTPGAFHISRSDLVREASMEMNFPRWYYGLRLTASRKHDLPGVIKSEIIAGIITQEVTEGLFRAGITAECTSDILTYPEECMSLDMRIKSAGPTLEYERILSEILDRMASEGVSQERILSVRQSVSNRMEREEHSGNLFWIDVLKARYIYGKDFYTLRKRTLSAVTPAEINAELKKYIEESRRATARLVPEVIETPEMDDIIL